MTNRLLSRLTIALAGAALLTSNLAAANVPAAPGDASHTLHQLFDAAWAREMRENPVEASLDGVHEYDDRWPDLSSKAIAEHHEEDLQTLRDLAAIPREQLDARDRLNYDLFEYRYQQGVASYGFHEYVFALNQLGGIQTSYNIARSLPFRTESDYANWIARLERFGTYMDQTIALLAEGIREGRTQPKVVMERIPRQITAQIVSDPGQSDFYHPFETMPSTIPAERQEALRSRAKKAIREVVVPAFERLQTFFNDRYLPHSRDSIAASTLPDGKAYYGWLVRSSTTTDMTPEQVHSLGLRKVDAIHAEMKQIFDQLHFDGSYRDFLHFLRTDPRFYYTNPDDLLEAYRAAAKRVDPHLVELFLTSKLPKVPYGIRKIPDALAPDTYPAYSVPPAGDGSVAGYMEVNLYKPESRPKYDIQVLTCHEARPGHQLQIPIAMELGNVPQFRRFDYYSAFGEGWALYSETLCEEMGLYDDAYARFGYLDYQMWRAVRLVVDTGMHAFGWPRERAVKYFEENTALSEQNIATEVDRYIAWPGQSLSYMVGEVRIQELRHEAEKRLGSRFDIRAFDSLLLENGAIPLELLTNVVDEWIDQTSRTAE
ncbi:MAG: DUF885 domain-containing protein [Thermoanaerobaculia bacterium]